MSSQKSAADSHGLGAVRQSLIASMDQRLGRLGIYRAQARPIVKMQSLLAAVAIVTAALFLIEGAVTKWHNADSGVGVDILTWIVWVLYSFARIALVVVIVVTVYEWFNSRRNSTART